MEQSFGISLMAILISICANASDLAPTTHAPPSCPNNICPLPTVVEVFGENERYQRFVDNVRPTFDTMVLKGTIDDQDIYVAISGKIEMKQRSGTGKTSTARTVTKDAKEIADYLISTYSFYHVGPKEIVQDSSSYEEQFFVLNRSKNGNLQIAFQVAGKTYIPEKSPVWELNLQIGKTINELYGYTYEAEAYDKSAAQPTALLFSGLILSLPFLTPICAYFL